MLPKRGNGAVATVEAGYPPVREDNDSNAEAAGETFRRGACCRI
jgi:hypothetical protein